MAFTQAYGSGGSVNNAQSAGWSQSGTDALSARAWSEAQSALAWDRTMSAQDKVMAFNAAEAQKQRDWEERMANTIYTRSVANMREAGINPILAANMGLSGAAVGSGATASIGGAGTAPVAQNFMDSWSASENSSESHGSSWQSSESGLMTALSALSGVLGGVLDKMHASSTINLNMQGLENIFREMGSDVEQRTTENGTSYGLVSEPNSNYASNRHGEERTNYYDNIVNNTSKREKENQNILQKFWGGLMDIIGD